MNIALTADLHLTTRLDHPERYSALEDILSQMRLSSIQTLIIAGDLFDTSQNQFTDFERLCKEHADVQFLIVPGNHDPSLRNQQIAVPNMHIFTRPELHCLEPESIPFFFLPYEKGKTMGERIAEVEPQLSPNHWVLVAHGDYLESLREANPYEDGFYMPFTRRDLVAFQPARAFLGHIHLPADRDPVFYTGSPCGLDITETGPRRFLVYDLCSDRVESRRVNSAVIFINETLTIFPMENEAEYLQQKTRAMIRKWDLSPIEIPKVRLRLKVNGFSSDRESLLRILYECFNGFAYYKNELPDITEVAFSTDPDRSALAEVVRQRITERPWFVSSDEPGEDEILLATLKLIFGDKNGSSH